MVALAIVTIVLDRIHHNDLPVGLEFLASLVEVGALIFALALTVVENQKSYLSSNVLLVFWLASIFTTGAKLRTVALSCPASDSTDLTLVLAKVAITTLVFGLECVRKDAGVQLGQDDDTKCPEDEANVFSIASFHWVTGLMRKGYAKPLTMDDLWVLRKQDQSHSVSDTFAAAWEKELKKTK